VNARRSERKLILVVGEKGMGRGHSRDRRCSYWLYAGRGERSARLGSV